MKILHNRLFLAIVFTLGVVGFAGAMWVTCLAFANHRSFPWAVWLFGIHWFWGAWLAGNRLFKQAIRQGRH